nr:MAG TPA: hypothetical protein [Caudoviricetes sp.]
MLVCRLFRLFLLLRFLLVKGSKKSYKSSTSQFMTAS